MDCGLYVHPNKKNGCVRNHVCHFDCKRILGVDVRKTNENLNAMIAYMKYEVDVLRVDSSGIQLPLTSLPNVQKLEQEICDNNKKLVISLF